MAPTVQEYITREPKITARRKSRLQQHTQLSYKSERAARSDVGYLESTVSLKLTNTSAIPGATASKRVRRHRQPTIHRPTSRSPSLFEDASPRQIPPPCPQLF